MGGRVGDEEESGKLRPEGKKVIERRMRDGGGEGKKGMEGRVGESGKR